MNRTIDRSIDWSIHRWIEWSISQLNNRSIKAVICIKNFGFALRLRTFVQKFLTWGHNPQPQPQTQPSDHGSWICILWSPQRGRSPLRRPHSMQIQDPWSDGCVCSCGCGLCPQVKNFCTKVLNLRAKPKFLMHITAFIFQMVLIMMTIFFKWSTCNTHVQHSRIQSLPFCSSILFFIKSSFWLKSSFSSRHLSFRNKRFASASLQLYNGKYCGTSVGWRPSND